MRGKFYTTTEAAWRAMLSSIVGARESIYLEMYIFDGDTAGYDFLRELEIKARAGVRVVVILDALGSFGLATNAIEQLRNAGAEVLFFNYLLRRTHRKILIVDEWIVFLGGVNISGKFAKWGDLQVRITGRVAKIAVRSFSNIYHECGGKNPGLVKQGGLRLFSRARTWFIESGVQEKFWGLRKHYEEHIDSATKSIVLVTPYLLPHPWMLTRLHRARIRGVSITILVPKNTDHSYADRINYFYLSIFEKMGVRCLLGEGMNHAKVMLVDERIGTMGSQNLDTLSFDWNVEAGIFFDDAHMVRDLKVIIDTWMLHAEDFGTLHYFPSWYDTIVAYCLRLFQRSHRAGKKAYPR